MTLFFRFNVSSVLRKEMHDIEITESEKVIEEYEKKNKIKSKTYVPIFLVSGFFRSMNFSQRPSFSPHFEHILYQQNIL